MPDWGASMQQTFEYYTVDTGTWKDVSKLDNVKSSTINRDEDSETLGSAVIDVTESVGECYIRIYLITVQNGIAEKTPLGTFLIQTPSSSFNGKVREVSMDAYTPLLEAKEKQAPLGYYVAKGENIMDSVYRLTRENVRAPVVRPESDETLHDDFVAEADETWISFLSALSENAKFKFDIDELGRILFAPVQDISSMQPVWTYTDDNSSILYPDFSMEHDLYGIPNIVEIVYSNGHEFLYSRIVNDDPNSPVSTVRRGREIVYRVTDLTLPGLADQNQIDEYAAQLLKQLSSVEYTVSYTHGYCPVRVGDCVRLNYTRAGVAGIKAKVVSQSIKCVPGCPVEEKAVFTMKLWR